MFLDLSEQHIGNQYKLKEIIIGKEISSGNYFLVEVELEKYSKVLKFSRTQNGKPDVFVIEAHAQFGDKAWRRGFPSTKGVKIYQPIGAALWNNCLVEIEVL